MLVAWFRGSLAELLDIVLSLGSFCCVWSVSLKGGD
jgi:hypothetical protein